MAHLQIGRGHFGLCYRGLTLLEIDARFLLWVPKSGNQFSGVLVAFTGCLPVVACMFLPVQ